MKRAEPGFAKQLTIEENYETNPLFVPKAIALLFSSIPMAMVRLTSPPLFTKPPMSCLPLVLLLQKMLKARVEKSFIANPLISWCLKTKMAMTKLMALRPNYLRVFKALIMIMACMVFPLGPMGNCIFP